MGGGTPHRYERLILPIGKQSSHLARGLELTMGRSKTDPVGKGVVIAMPEGIRIRPKLWFWSGWPLRVTKMVRCSAGLTCADRGTGDPMSDKASAG